MIEIACFNTPSSITAAASGADRIELCASYSSGGVTPSLSTLVTIRQHFPAIPINVMIRPRGDNFVYFESEFELMKTQIQEFKASGAVQGVVFGILTVEGKVDGERCGELVRLAAPLECTFHRAVDEVDDLNAALEEIVGLGFKSVLTSGGKRSASEGVEVVARLQERFGSRISLILGGGVRTGNVSELKDRAGVEWVHSAAITRGDEAVDADEVSSMVALLQQS